MPPITFNPTKQILGLDPASKTGYAHSNGKVGVWPLGTGNERLLRLRDFVLDSARAWGVKTIACEHASFGSHHTHGQALANELLSVVKACAAELGVPLVTYGPSSIKKFICGNGRAEKSQVMAAVETWTGIKPANSDEADAIAVLLLCQAGYVSNTARKKRRASKPRSTKARRAAGYLF